MVNEAINGARGVLYDRIEFYSLFHGFERESIHLFQGSAEVVDHNGVCSRQREVRWTVIFIQTDGTLQQFDSRFQLSRIAAMLESVYAAHVTVIGLAIRWPTLDEHWCSLADKLVAHHYSEFDLQAEYLVDAAHEFVRGHNLAISRDLVPDFQHVAVTLDRTKQHTFDIQ